MNVKSEALTEHLASNFANVYLLFGAELLLIDESVGSIRKQAVANGFDERNYFDFSTKQQSEQRQALIETLSSASLFSQKRLVECHFNNGITTESIKLINQALAMLSQDDVLIIATGKLSYPQQKAKWFNDINQKGVVVQHFSVQPLQLVKWLERRMQQMALAKNSDIAELIAFYTEGNLLASQQELVKLKLAYGSSSVDVGVYQQQIEQQSQYSVYGLIDAALKAEGERVYKIHNILKQNDIEAMALIGALNKEISTLVAMAIDMRLKVPLMAIFKKHNVWQTKQTITGQALARLSYAMLQKILIHLGRIERSHKGLDIVDVWDELLAICLTLAGKKLWIN